MQTVNPIYSDQIVVKENAAFIVRHPGWGQEGSMDCSHLNSPVTFKGRVFKDKRRESVMGCDQLMDIHLSGWWWGDGWVNILNAAVQPSGVYMPWVISIGSFFHLSCPGAQIIEESTSNAQDWDLILGSGRSLGEGMATLQYYCLENSKGQRSLGAQAGGSSP